jgi:pyruvate/2-oxoglutarate/acetoin dehydrogenase E1 component
MRTLDFGAAIEDTLAQAMATDPRIIIMGEDVHLYRVNLFTRFGDKRVLATPISEGAFVGAAVGAAMAGLRPVVEVMLVDFIGPAVDALLNHAAKVEAFSGGQWKVPMVVRAACGGGYGDGGQHEQSLWGWLAHIPGLTVVAPSTPADAGGLMLAAIEHEGPVVYLEHKLLADYWLEWMGRGGRETVQFDVPAAGATGPVPDAWVPTPIGQAIRRWEGDDVTLISVGVGVHRCMEAARMLVNENIYATVIDLRTVSPLDRETICEAARRTERVVVVDEDYEACGLSGEVSAVIAEEDIPIKFRRVCTRETIPYDRRREDQVLPNVGRIVAAVKELVPAWPS